MLYYVENNDNYTIGFSELVTIAHDNILEKHYYAKKTKDNITTGRITYSEYYEEKDLKYTIDYDEEFNQYVNLIKNGTYTAPQYSYPNSTITVKYPDGTVAIYRYDENGKKI